MFGIITPKGSSARNTPGPSARKATTLLQSALAASASRACAWSNASLAGPARDILSWRPYGGEVHVDGGINLNSCYFVDPSGAPIGPTHRKLVAYTGTVPSGHGTHTAGSAAGDAAPVSGSTLDRGLAYLARIAA